MTGWYTVFCKPRGESTAEANLNNQGYTVYLPRLLTQRRRAGKWVNLIQPLFPRYLFLKPRDGEQSLSPVRSTLGVASLVGFGTQPALVPNDVIAGLRAQEDAAAGVHVFRRNFQPGDAVKLLDGPFCGLQAIFDKETGEERVIVLLELLGKMNSLTVERRWLAPTA